MNRPLSLFSTALPHLVPSARSSVSLAKPSRPIRTVSSQVLLEGERELVIRHQGGEYHLRLTRNDKLILTK